MGRETGEKTGMKILIVYATKGGVSRRCAEILTDLLTEKHEVTCLNIEENPPSPDSFDVAVVGGSIRMGALDKKLKKYIKENAQVLSDMPSAAFLCLGFINNFEEYRDIQFPKELVCSLGIHCFGGELKPDKLKGLDKLIVKAVRSSLKSEDFENPYSERDTLPEILPETITRLADKIRGLL